MNIARHGSRSVIVALLLTLAACGGGGDEGAPVTPPAPPLPPPPPAGTVIGAAGGTVTAGGATLVIPAGALSQDTTITVAISSSGANLPEGATVKGSVFDFGPNGTAFSVPATLLLPLDGAPGVNERAVVSFLDPSSNRWIDVASTVTGTQISATVSHFTPYAARFALELKSSPRREWSLWRTEKNRFAYGYPTGPSVIGEQIGGEVRVPFLFGAASFTFEQDNGESPDLAMGEVYSSANGESFSAYAEAPNEAGGLALLRQFQSYVKRAPDATLQLVVSAGFLAASDHNGRPNESECGAGLENLSDEEILHHCWPLFTQIEFKAVAFRGPFGPGNQPVFFSVHGAASMYGFGGKWKLTTPVFSDSATPLWTAGDFTVLASLDGRNPLVTITEPRVINVDLSSIEVCAPEIDAIFCADKAFTLFSLVSAEAANLRGRESGAAAYIRDPQNISGNVIQATGLEATNNPLPLPADLVVDPLPCASGSEPAAGVLQFSAADYRASEGLLRNSEIIVTRTRGSSGAVSATFTTGDGTAATGLDYKVLSTTVLFADGDTMPRTVALEFLPDTIAETDETILLALSAPGGCATIGAQAGAVLTMVDDDQPVVVAKQFTVGGTVTGLVGTGLRLEDLQRVPIEPGNGPFTFTLPTQSGSPYAVTVLDQPDNPIQVCTVSNGSGTMADANVTNVSVSCVTKPASGALDRSFNGTGTVSTAFGGDETAMVLQPDGKILMVGGSGTDFVLARYHTDGRLDESFGSLGTVTTDIAGGFDAALGVALQPDDKIVVVGSAGGGSTDNYAIVRYLANGDVDSSFGTLGKVTVDFGGKQDRAYAVAIQPDDRIVVVGEAVVPLPGSPGFFVTDFGIVRLDANGTPDASFDTDGKLTAHVGGLVSIARNVVLQGDDGAILVSGVLALDSPVLAHTGLVRFSTTGVLDRSFGVQGMRILRDLTLSEALVLQSDGRILVAGGAGLMRLDANGATEFGFGNGGLAFVDFSSQSDFVRALAVQADGRILVAGLASDLSDSSTYDFGVARFDSSGVLDPSFDSDGILTLDFFGLSDGAENVAVQSDGRIVLGGFARSGSRTGYGLARINP